MRTLQSKAFRWIILGVSLVGLLTAASIIVVRNLSAPPPVYQDVYNFNLGGLASIEIDPSSDHLLALPDETVQIYVPQGAYPEGGSLVILPRTSSFIPRAIEDQTLRLLAADVFVVAADGDVRSTVNLERSLLICFSLDSEQQLLALDDEIQFSVQRYDESLEAPAWMDLPPSPGWTDGQVCTATDHLSLYALAMTFPLGEEVPTPTAEPEELEPVTDEMEPYGIPTVSP